MPPFPTFLVMPVPGGLDDDRWRALSPHLDHALDMTGEQRSAWLTSLRAVDTALAVDLEALLAQHDALTEVGFLEGTPPQPPGEGSLAGQALGAYTLRSRIGQGGMGSVWLAERNDGRFEGAAAVKLLNASLVGREGEARFRREGSVLARLRHSHIAHLIDAGVSPLGQPYLVLEHVDGQRIDRYCDAREAAVEARIRLFLDVLAAVAHAHANLIVHRDIKPSNVMVTADGQVKLLDFGIAKLLEVDGASEVTGLTRDGEAALTPEYAAPEQLTGGHVTTATDVYALGVLLYVLLTGQHPAGGDATPPADLVRAIVDTEAPRVSSAVTGKLNRLLQGDLDNIVAKALKKSPEERYPSVGAMADDLRRYLGHQPVSARPDSLAYRASKFVRRNRTAVQLAALVLIAVGAGLAGTVSQARRARAQAARADHEARLANEQRDFALRQLSRAQAINDLNAFLLFDAAPLGQPFTVGQLLARAEQIIDRQAVEAENRIDLLVAIGLQYDNQDEHDTAQRVLARAYELSRRSLDPSTRAAAGCAFAISLAQGGDTARAEQLVQDSLAELPAKPQFALHRTLCLVRGSDVARHRGDGSAAVERVEAAQRVLSDSGFSSALLDLRLAMDRAESYRMADRNREAVAAFEEAFARLTALGRGETETAGTLLNNWALVLADQGLPLQAERLFRQAIAISSADGSDQNVSPMLLNNLGRALGDLHRFPEAADYAERAYARAQRSGNDAVITYALVARALVYRQKGDLPRAAEMLAELEPRMRRRWPATHVAYALLASEHAEIARARGDMGAALSGANQAVALSREATRAGFLGRALRRRSALQLQMGEADRAAADAGEALRVELQEVAAGTLSNTIGLSYLALGRALQAQGSSGDAQAAFASAVQHLKPSLGEQHPETRAAQELASGAPVPARRSR